MTIGSVCGASCALPGGGAPVGRRIRESSGAFASEANASFGRKLLVSIDEINAWRHSLVGSTGISLGE
jgi:hypothetical protein